MLTGRSAELLDALRHALPSWECALDGDRVTFTKRSGRPYRPPLRPRSWADLLATLEAACAERGIARAHPLPLRGLNDAELTFSAVQALDPYLKHHQHHTYGTGFFAQPVVRLTGQRDEHGTLRPGFATSFVNTSVVQPIRTVEEHAALIDAWLGVLSRLGFHAQHLATTGSLSMWHRAPVCGITLRFHHGELTFGDAVLLWNADAPAFLATDIGSGLERLRWALTRRPWLEVVYGALADQVDSRVLDAVRTSTLITGSGISPSPRGPGSTVRRLLRAEAERIGGLGLSRVIRWAHEYWSLSQPLPVPWPEVCRVLDAEAVDFPSTTGTWATGC